MRHPEHPLGSLVNKPQRQEEEGCESLSTIKLGRTGRACGPARARGELRTSLQPTCGVKWSFRCPRPGVGAVVSWLAGCLVLSSLSWPGDGRGWARPVCGG